jgi:galactose mutarotase-like enzyme
MLRLTSDDATLAIDTERGGRIRSLVVAGRELIIWERLRTIDWGSYPMAPFAGRLRDGVFEFHGHTYRLPATEGPNAIHGTTLDQDWAAIDAGTIVVELADPWPFRGRVTQQFELHPDRLDATMTLDADEPMPAVLGWHPWFIRRIDGVDAELEFRAARMYERGPDGLPTGHLVAPPPPPWDDCFVDVSEGPTVRWPGLLEVTLESDASHWVVYTGDPDGLAIEPQTGPPDGPNIEPHVVVPGSPLTLHITWRWRRLDR